MIVAIVVSLLSALVGLPAAVDPEPYVADGYQATVSTTRPAAGEGFVLDFDGEPDTVIVLTIESVEDDTGSADASPGQYGPVVRLVSADGDAGTAPVLIDGSPTSSATRTTDAAGHIEFGVELTRAAQYALVLASDDGDLLYRQVVTVVDESGSDGGSGVLRWLLPAGGVLLALLFGAVLARRGARQRAKARS